MLKYSERNGITGIEETVFQYETSVVGAVAEAATEITVADTEPFVVGHVVKIGEELVVVNAVDVANKKIQVTRGYADTVPTAYVDGARIEVLFREGEEGAEFVKARAKGRKIVQNKTQIFSESIEISNSALEVAQVAIDDLYAHQKDLKQQELVLQLEKMMINGVSFDNGVIRQSRGLRSFIQNVTDAAGEELNVDHINDLAQGLYEKGAFKNGGRYVLLAGAKQKRAFGKLDSAKIQIPQGSGYRGDIVDAVVTDFAQFQIALNNNLAPDEIMLVDLDRIKLRPLGSREFSHTYHGVQSDATKGTILGEYVLEVKQADAMARIKGLK